MRAGLGQIMCLVVALAAGGFPAAAKAGIYATVDLGPDGTWEDGNNGGGLGINQTSQVHAGLRALTLKNGGKASKILFDQDTVNEADDGKTLAVRFFVAGYVGADPAPGPNGPCDMFAVMLKTESKAPIGGQWFKPTGWITADDVKVLSGPAVADPAHTRVTNVSTATFSEVEFYFTVPDVSTVQDPEGDYCSYDPYGAGSDKEIIVIFYGDPKGSRDGVMDDFEMVGEAVLIPEPATMGWLRWVRWACYSGGGGSPDKRSLRKEEQR